MFVDFLRSVANTLENVTDCLHIGLVHNVVLLSAAGSLAPIRGVTLSLQKHIYSNTYKENVCISNYLVVPLCDNGRD